MRVTQEACVEYQICFPRKALGVGEGHQRHRHLGLIGIRAKMPFDQAAQVGDRQSRRIHDHIRLLPQRFGQGDLRGDTLHDNPLWRQGMSAAGFRVAAEQGAFVGPGINQLDVQARRRT